MLVNSRFFISNLTRRLKCINECTINPYLGGWLALSNFCENSYLAAKKVWGYGLREVWVTRKRSSKYKMGVVFRRKAVRFLVLLLIIYYFPNSSGFDRNQIIRIPPPNLHTCESHTSSHILFSEFGRSSTSSEF